MNSSGPGAGPSEGLSILDLNSVVAYFFFAFGFGLLWYRTLRHPQTDHLRMLGFPVLGIAGMEMAVPNSVPSGPEVMGVHIAIAFLGSLAAVFVDITVRERSLTWWAKR